MNAREDSLDSGSVEPVHAPEQAGEHRAIVGQNRIVAVLEQGRLLNLDLFAEDAAAIDAATHHPIDAAMAVIGAAVAVLPEGAAKFGNDDDHRVAPGGRPDLLGEAGEPSPKFAETVGEIAVGGALIDVRIPAADIDEAEVELLAHQPTDAP